mgnify:CR=1 FL=1|jgi:uncharacterized protein YjbI with pentapeptide repeats
MKCKFESEYTHKKCDENALPGQDYCIFHSDFPKDKDKLKSELKNKITNRDYNFEGYKLYSLELSNINTNNGLQFRNATFKEDFILKNGKVSSINFYGAHVIGNVEIKGSEITKFVHFNNDVVIGGDVKFNGTKIHMGCDFSNDNEKEYLNSFGVCNFSSIDVKGKLDFSNVKICGNINFVNAKTQKDLSFQHANINGKADFREVIINGNAYFNSFWENKTFKVKDEAYFDGLNVKKDLHVNGAIFNKKVGFKRINVIGNSNFSQTKFLDDVDFSNAKFEGETEFEKTIFEKEANFKNASFLFRGIFAELNPFNASFENAWLKNVIFNECDLTKVRFKHVIFDNCELSTSKLPKKIPEHIEYDNNKNEELKSISDTYKRIKKALQQEGEYDLAGEFYIKEMDSKKRLYHIGRTRIFYEFLSLLTRYGEKFNILFGFIVLFYAFLIVLVYFCHLNQSSPWFIYFNIITVPVGSFLMALFVYIFARKMAR